MALFIIICKDKPGALETRMATRPVHLDYLKGSEIVKIGGALLDDDGNPLGSVIIVEAEDASAAKQLAENDPYVAAGVFETVEIRPYRVAVGSL